MIWETVRGIAIPFLGTALGAGCVFFLKGNMDGRVQRALQGFAGGVMLAASVWSLLIPAIDRSAGSFVPAAVGLWAGVLFLLVIDKLFPPLRTGETGEGKRSMLMLAVTVHNIPEGMAVGVIYAGYLARESGITALAALTLALGVAIQNFPEGAIISMPLRAEGMGKGKAFLYGVASGVVEPLGALLPLMCASLVVPVMPYLLSFAAGAMLYVVAEELIPEMLEGEGDHLGTLLFMAGFTLMMALDVALG